MEMASAAMIRPMRVGIQWPHHSCCGGAGTLAGISVYTGNSIASLTRVPDRYGGRSNQIEFGAVAGATYRSAVQSQSIYPFTLALRAPAPPPYPRLSSFRHLALEGVELSFEVIPGRTNVPETSTDLLNWVPISTSHLNCGIISLRDADGVTGRHRFYRVRTQ